MHHRRCYASVCTLNGKIYALGGNNGIMRLRSAEVYCPKTNQWTLIASMNRRRSDADACAFNDRIYITGSVLISIIFTQNDPKKNLCIPGGYDGNNSTHTCEVYNATKDEWSTIADMLNRRSGHKCIVHNEFIYVIGGFDDTNRLNLCEKYNPVTNSWLTIREMNIARINFGIAVIDDMIFVAGGFTNSNPTNSTEFYLDNENQW